MKTIITEDDIASLRGKFVVQLNNNHTLHNMTNRFKTNPEFWLEKRISFIGVLYGVDGIPHCKPKEELIIMNGMYYTHGIYTHEKFIKYWNNYLDSNRYHRLLIASELDWLLLELKK